MKRRNFIQLSSTVSVLVASGKLPLLFAEPKGRTLAPIEPISSAVQKFHPVMQPFGLADDCGLEYELVRWHYRKKGTVNNIDTGTLRIKRAGSSGQTHYSVDQKVSLPNRQDAFVEATMDTEGPLELPLRWSVKRWHTNPGGDAAQSGSQVVVQGEYRDGAICLFDGSFTTTHSFSDPLVMQWALPFVLGNAKVKPFRFNMLDDGLKFKPNQVLRYCGTIPIPTAQGEIPLDAYLQTGTGILPIHWLVDAQGRTQLMTQSVMNWMLKSIRA